MCCFSGDVDRVADTNILARSVHNGRQILVYAMTIATKNDIAMILSLPLPPNSAEDINRGRKVEARTYSESGRGGASVWKQAAADSKAVLRAAHFCGTFGRRSTSKEDSSEGTTS